mgnify:CR=1 FL=1
MIVVSNTSVILNLAAVGQLNLLEQLYGKVVIPEAVFRELLALGSELPLMPQIKSLLWIETRSVTNCLLVDSLLLELDEGEAEAVVLAMEIQADLLLLDERRGRKAASRWGLKLIGLLGILIEAKRRGFIGAVRPILDDLITKAGFWISRQLYARVLQEAEE